MVKNALLAMIFILACSQQKQDQSEQTEAEDTITDSTLAEAASLGEEESALEEEDRFAHAGAIEVEIQDFNFPYDPFKNSIQEIIRGIGEHTVENIPYENIHVENVVDTMVHIQFGESSIDYFKSQDGKTIFITKATVRSPKILFKKDIRVGMTINDFKDRFDELKNKDDFKIVKIVGEDGLYVVTCNFENGILAQIDFQGFLD